MKKKRAAGILMPIFSLDSKYGIGAFSESAYRFVDMLAAAGQRYWQILPLGPTSYGDSPYQSFSTFAGNPYFIDLEELTARGLLTEEECRACDFGDDPGRVDYEKLYRYRRKLLDKAYRRSGLADECGDARSLERGIDGEDDGDTVSGNGIEYQKFVRENRDWLDEYALYMAVKDAHGGIAWSGWEEPLRLRDARALEQCRTALAPEIGYYRFVQFVFYSQWRRLKTYANGKGIQIVGDIPIYVAYDSADTWANPELFQLDAAGLPTRVAGCPPDAFSETGQLWGNPLYDWGYHEQTGFAWWIKRLRQCYQLYDVVRIDHFRGFDEYYAIPYGDRTAEFGRWEKGPGMKLFRAVRAALGRREMIAEDLGFMTDSVRKLVKTSGFPNMKVLEFAFDARDAKNPSGRNEHLPHNYPSNCVVYTGTHDNETVRGWFDSISDAERRSLRNYLGKRRLTGEEACRELIRTAMASVADICIIPMQDYLGYDNRARINTPSTLGGNWEWRMESGAVTEKLVREIRRLTDVYGRGTEK